MVKERGLDSILIWSAHEERDEKEGVGGIEGENGGVVDASQKNLKPAWHTIVPPGSIEMVVTEIYSVTAMRGEIS